MTLQVEQILQRPSDFVSQAFFTLHVRENTLDTKYMRKENTEKVGFHEPSLDLYRLMGELMQDSVL